MQRDDTFRRATGSGWQPASPRFRQIILERVQRQEFMKHIGCVLTTIDAGYVEAELAVTPQLLQHDGIVHGGVVATLADVVAGFAAYTLVAEHQSTVTVDLLVSYLAPARGVRLRAAGRVYRHGRTFSVARVEVFSIDAAGSSELVALAQATFAIRTVRPSQ